MDNVGKSDNTTTADSCFGHFPIEIITMEKTVKVMSVDVGCPSVTMCNKSELLHALSETERGFVTVLLRFKCDT